MAYSTAGLNAGVNGVAAAGAYISAHTADPGATGASEVAGTTRQLTTWAAAAGGQRAGSQISMAIGAGVTITYWGLWSAATGGTFLGAWALAAPEAFGGAGTWLHTPTLVATN
jgi:hypothetical protein